MRVAGISAVAVIMLFTACSSGDAGKLEQWQGELPVARAFLRGQLPPGTIVYARVPNLLGLLTMPKQGQLEEALHSEANIRAVESIQQGLARNVLTLPSLSDPWLDFIADAVRSPIEVAGFAMPAPSALFGATLAVRSAEDFNQLFAGLGEGDPPISLAAPLDAQGTGELVGLPFMAFVKFDAATGRMLLHAGPGVNRATFENVLKSLPAELKDHPMYALEQKIDASGQGLFAWADAAQIKPMLGQMAQPLAQAGLGGLRAVAFGLGTANEKGRLSLVLDVGNDRRARPFPVVANDIAATAVGDPDAVFLLSIPGPSEITRLESMLLAALPPGARSGWEQAKANAARQIGVGIEEIFAAIGPDVLVLFDEVGDYAAVRLRDPELFDDIVRRIAAGAGPDIQERKVGGETIRHWRVPSLFSVAATAEPGAQDGTGGDVLKLLARVQNHVYWMRDGDYLYVAQAPQPLIDRVRTGAKARVGEWLARTQGLDTSTSLFAATGSVHKMPRRSYETYVGILQFLADISEAEFDAWSMPTADQLDLADEGAIGFSLNLGEPYLSLELSYESHPGELFLGGGGVGGVAALGILAAIAVPAYQDYTIRAQVTEGLNLASPVKVAVAQSFATRDALPRDRRAAGLPPSADSTSGKYVEAIEIARGVITITYGSGANPRLRGQTLSITPVTNSSRDVIWLCGYAGIPAGARPLVPEGADVGAGTTIEPKYLPSACR